MEKFTGEFIDGEMFADGKKVKDLINENQAACTGKITGYSVYEDTGFTTEAVQKGRPNKPGKTGSPIIIPEDYFNN